MKKILLLSLFLALGCLALQAQYFNPFPIPSFNVPIDSSYARFQENVHSTSLDASREKRDVHVRIIKKNAETQDCEATVWIYSLDGLDILGPYTVLCGETLVVPIDDRLWGVLVQSNSEIEVDVWIE